MGILKIAKIEMINLRTYSQLIALSQVEHKLATSTQPLLAKDIVSYNSLTS